MFREGDEMSRQKRRPVNANFTLFMGCPLLLDQHSQKNQVKILGRFPVCISHHSAWIILNQLHGKNSVNVNGDYKIDQIVYAIRRDLPNAAILKQQTWIYEMWIQRVFFLQTDWQNICISHFANVSAWVFSWNMI